MSALFIVGLMHLGVPRRRLRFVRPERVLDGTPIVVSRAGRDGAVSARERG